jgi:hypothetical protein
VFWLPALLAAVAALVAIGLLAPERLFHPYLGLLVGIGVVLWAQGNLLVIDYGLLDGQAMDWTAGASQSPYEVAVWVGVPVAGAALGAFAPTLAPFVGQLLVGQALLAIKPPGARGPLQVSDAPTAISDIPATILDLLDLPHESLPGIPVAELDAAAGRERSYAAYAWRNEDWRQRFFQHLDVFSVNGDPVDGAAWSFDRTIYDPNLAPGDRTRGLFGAERDPRGELFHWGGAYVSLQAPEGTSGLTLEVRSIAPEAQTLRVVINGESRDEIALADHEWHVLDYALSEGSDPDRGRGWNSGPIRPTSPGVGTAGASAS